MRLILNVHRFDEKHINSHINDSLNTNVQTCVFNLHNRNIKSCESAQIVEVKRAVLSACFPM